MKLIMQFGVGLEGNNLNYDNFDVSSILSAWSILIFFILLHHHYQNWLPIINLCMKELILMLLQSTELKSPEFQVMLLEMQHHVQRWPYI